MSAKIKVALIYGGKSGEHEISILSARSVLKAMDKNKYEVLPIHIHKSGEWQIGGQQPIYLDQPKEDHSVDQPEENALENLQSKGIQPYDTIISEEIDVIFPLLHGPNGEDGTIQGMLQLAGKAYVGAGVLASAVGMDKVVMKRLFAEAGIPQGDFISFLRKEIEQKTNQVVKEIEERLGYPCFVKPANLGSSVGISKARNREQLIDALHLACQYDRKVIVEQFINGREIELGVLGNDDPIVSIPGEIVPSNEFYDYTAKYTDGLSDLVIPAPLDEATITKLQEYAIRAFKAIDGSGLSRVDFFVERTTGEIFINEINTMPGFTKYSMYPLLWQHSGISYDELIDRLIQLALERHEDLNRSISS